MLAACNYADIHRHSPWKGLPQENDFLVMMANRGCMLAIIDLIGLLDMLEVARTWAAKGAKLPDPVHIALTVIRAMGGGNGIQKGLGCITNKA